MKGTFLHFQISARRGGMLSSGCLSSSPEMGASRQTALLLTGFSSVKPGVGLGTCPLQETGPPRAPPLRLVPALLRVLKALLSTASSPPSSQRSHLATWPCLCHPTARPRALRGSLALSFGAWRNQLPSRQPSILKNSPGHALLLKIMGVSSEHLLLKVCGSWTGTGRSVFVTQSLEVNAEI